MKLKKEDVPKVVDKVFGIYERQGDTLYNGEPITQTEHMTQCAMLAEQAGYSKEVVLATFLHDVGNMLCEEIPDNKRIIKDGVDYGPDNHDEVGANFLKDLGFPRSVYILAEKHVDALRYLLTTDPDYASQTSIASLSVAEADGGRMTDEELKAFEALPNFTALTQIRRWDESGKIEGLEIEPIKKYERLCTEYLLEIAA